MSEKSRSNIGIILAVITIIVSFTVPEVRSLLGLGDNIRNEVHPEKNETKEISEEKENSKRGNHITKTENQNLERGKRKEPNKTIAKVIQKRPQIQVNIYDEGTGKRELKFENYLKEIIEFLDYKHIEIKGNKSVKITPNKTVSNQVSAAIEMSISMNGKSLNFPMFYGRGDTKKEAINHALILNKENITNKIKSLK